MPYSTAAPLSSSYVYPCTCGKCRQAVPAPPFTGAVTTSQQFPLTNASAQPMFLVGQGGLSGVDPAALAAAVLPRASSPAPAPSGGIISVQAFSGPLSASAGRHNSSCEMHAAPVLSSPSTPCWHAACCLPSVVHDRALSGGAGGPATRGPSKTAGRVLLQAPALPQPPPARPAGQQPAALPLQRCQRRW